MSARMTRHTLSSTTAGVIGNVMEWYDFALFGYFAPIIASHFFPDADPLTSLLQTYGVFAAGFLMRPLGAVIFGYIGDRFGRSRALILSVIMMGGPTFCLGLLPTYDQIGLWAPGLLVVIRLVQGLSVGGEFSSSVTYMVETAPTGRRGYAGSWANFGSLSGTLLGSGTAAAFATILSTASLETWGWRVPFLLGILLAGFAFYMRRNLPDTQLFKEHEKNHVDDNPLHEALTRNLKQTVLAVLFASGYGVFFYIPLVYLPSYADAVTNVSLALALRINTLGTALMLPLIPLIAIVSDRWVRRKYLLIGAFSAMAVAAYPVFTALARGRSGALLAGQLLFAVLVAFSVAIAPTMFVEMFPTEDRLTGYSLAFNIGLGLVGGTAPMIATWLIETTGMPAAPGMYLAGLSLLSVVALVFMRDRSREPLL
jgi:MHS family proline/betaine transporter-like MFS transporter